MNSGSGALALLLLSVSLVAKEPAPEAQQLMKQLATQGDELRQLVFPISEEQFDYESRHFEREATAIERLLSRLKDIDPDAANSSFEIYGKPFSDRLRATYATIDGNRKVIAAVKADAPNPEALAAVDDALRVARQAIAGKNHLKESYAAYEENMAQASALDIRAIEKRRDEIEKWGVPLIARYRAAEQAEQEKLAVAKAARNAEDDARKRNAQRNRERAKAEAKKLGYENIETGIAATIEQLREGSLTIRDAKKNLVDHDPGDEFRVQSVVGGYVVYAYQHRNAFFQVAVVPERDGFYGEGAELSTGLYAVQGMQALKTVLGAGTEIIVLKRVR